jgi:hypothetical protein
VAVGVVAMLLCCSAYVLTIPRAGASNKPGTEMILARGSLWEGRLSMNTIVALAQCRYQHLLDIDEEGGSR